MEMTNVDRRQAVEVIAGPYKGVRGCRVKAADVRGRAGWDYIESSHDGAVYEVRPVHVKTMRELVFGK